MFYIIGMFKIIIIVGVSLTIKQLQQHNSLSIYNHKFLYKKREDQLVLCSLLWSLSL